MEKVKIYDLSQCPLSPKNGLYGGAAGSKEGIIINNEFWLIKFPKNTKSMRNVDISYTNSPLCEYIGSHIYEILGYKTHKTILGVRNDKLVVACKDFTDPNTMLAEIRTIKNYVNEELSEKLGVELDETGSNHFVDLPTLMIHIENNPILKALPNLEQHFFEQMIIDVYINNSDRNNGNWGVLRHFDGSPDVIAPVYDNGGSFQNKLSEQKAQKQLQNKEMLVKNACSARTVYVDSEEKTYSPKRLFEDVSAKYPAFNSAINKVVPLIKERHEQILSFIDSIPEHVITKDKKGIDKQIDILTPGIREVFEIQLSSRLDNLLIPQYEKVKKKEKEFVPEM